MIPLLTYEQWLEQRLTWLHNLTEEIDCPECHGTGAVLLRDDQGHLAGSTLCGLCVGAGEVWFEDEPDRVADALLSPEQYLKTLARELTQWCQYTGDDFLGLLGQALKAVRSTTEEAPHGDDTGTKAATATAAGTGAAAPQAGPGPGPGPAGVHDAHHPQGAARP